MSYSKHVWANDELPAINDTNLNNIEDGIESAHNNFANYKLLSDFVVLTGSFTFVNGQTELTINYPEGFTKSNCIVLSFMAQSSNESGYTEGFLPTAVGYVMGALGKGIQLQNNGILIKLCNPTEGGHTSGTGSFAYKLTLMKIPEVVNNE